MLGASIFVTAMQVNHRMEGVAGVAGILPGMMLEIIPNTNPSPSLVGYGNQFPTTRPSFRPRSQVNGAAGQIIVAVEDAYQGFLTSQAYAVNTRMFAYAPIVGEEMNVLVADGPGTSDPITQGDLFSVTSFGELYHVTVGGATSIPWQAMETLPAISAPTLCWCTRL